MTPSFASAISAGSLPQKIKALGQQRCGDCAAIS